MHLRLGQQPALCVVATDRKFGIFQHRIGTTHNIFEFGEVLLVDFAGVHTLNEIGERSELALKLVHMGGVGRRQHGGRRQH